MFVLDINREELYRRIDKRVDDRLTEGMIEEVKGLIENGVSVTWLLSLGLEYRFITVYLMQNAKCKISSTGSLQVQNCGNYSYKSVISNTVRDPVGIEANEILRGAQDDSLRAQNDTHTRDEMILRLKFAIHAYARRQDTYFKRWPNAKWGDGEYITDQIEAYDELKSKKNYVV
jgi:tRNA A37 N6-isopentenylltransferase MiaA